MKLQSFLENNKSELIQIYIKERQNNGFGILNIDLTTVENPTVSYIPITSEILSDELKKDVFERKSKQPDSIIFIYGTELDDNNTLQTNLVQIDLSGS